MARSFSGDKSQLVPLIKAAIEHRGAAFIDCISPCIAFNNHDGSTKSFDYVRAHNAALNTLDFLEGRAPITTEYEPGTSQVVRLHDGSMIRLAKIGADYDVHDRIAAMNNLMQKQASGEIVTGLIYMAEDPRDLHDNLGTVAKPLNEFNAPELSPGAKALDAINAGLR